MRRRFFLGAGPALALTQLPGRAADQLPALLGGEPVRKKAWPSWPQTTPQDETTWLEALRACKWWRKEGHFVRDFETAWASRMGARHCLATANGTGALMASMHALDVGPKDEVIVSPYTFIATINAILAHYALPVFADSDPGAGLIDAAKIEALITPRTRCILPVHLGGYVADMDRIMDISKRRNIPVVEDACQAHLSEWRGRKASTIGHLGCFSFQKFKNLPGGEAGAVVTNDETLFRRAYGFHSHYRTPNEGPADPKGTNGINLRLAEFQASILLNQLTRLDGQAKRREENAAALTALLNEIPGVKPARMHDGCTRNAYHLYMLRYDDAAFSGLPRERFLRAAQAEGVPISAGYGQLNRDPFLENTLNSRPFRAVYSQQDIARWRERNQCPANDQLCRDGMWLSQSTLLATRTDMEDIATAIRKIQKHAGQLLKA
ncbi:MAG TPA: DegT/DnrJ/EryC1/StrS family aminotransferase [Bryobacteraceae bacterium]|nr:DegT/DnrJ/EryC1/StrS family aminotransferase [Bryobacteraceae bacterium]HPT25185.1 DegT/DnrJ/EryC1/StrS family aminotransferase [Bryobacteraceae bacterium]